MLTRDSTLQYKGTMRSDSTAQQIKKGLLVVAVLQVVYAKKSYSSEILARLATTSFATQEGTLYPLLSKLKREGLLDYEWAESASGPPRKYYALSPTGVTHKDELLAHYKDLGVTLQKLGEK